MLRFKKLMALVLVLVLSVAMLAACGTAGNEPGGGSGETTAGGSQATSQAAAETESKPAELTFCLAQDYWGGSTDPQLQEEFKKFMEEKTGTKITMIAPPHNSYSEKLNVLLSSGDIPDIYHIFTAMQNVPIYTRRGYLAPLDEYLKKSEVLESLYKDIYDKVSVIDGKTYAVPDGRNSLILMLLRKDILDKYGASIPTTTDEFYNEMKKIKDGIIPFTNAQQMSYFRFFFSSFGAYDDIVTDSDGKYIDGFNTAQMKDALVYLKKLYADGILDKEFITNQTGTMRDKVYSGKAAGSVYWDIYYTTFQVESQKIDPKAEIATVYRLKGPGGDGYTTNWGIDGAYGVSPKCNNTEAAVKVLEWLNTSEGYVAKCSGIEGKHYTIDSSGAAVPTEAAKNSGYTISIFNFIKFPGKLQVPFSFGAETEALADKQAEVYNQAMQALGPYYSVPSGKSDIYDKVQTSLKNKRTEICTKVISGAMSLDEAFKEYEAYWKSVDGDKMLQQLNS